MTERTSEPDQRSSQLPGGLLPKYVDHEERRRILVDALWRVVQRDGAAGISIRTVAEEANFPKSTLEHYFPDRLGLLEAAVGRIVTSAEGRLAALDLFDGRISTAVDAVMVAIPDSPARRLESEVWSLLTTERRSSSTAGAVAATLDDAVRNGIALAMSAWTTSGLVHPRRDHDIEVSRLHALIDGLSLHTVHDPAVLPPQRIRELIAAHLAELARPPAPIREELPTPAPRKTDD